MPFKPDLYPYLHLDADGIDTAYLDVGSGPPLVLIHGSGAGVTAIANWWPNIELLARSRRVLALELAGFGHSGPAIDDDYSIAMWVAQLEAFLDAVDVHVTDVIGNSLGGWVALRLAERHPQRVARMVLMGTGGAPARPDSLLAQHRSYEPSRAQMRRLLTDFVVDDGIITDALVEHRFLMSSTAEAQRRFGQTTAARARDRVEHALAATEVRGIRQPTLLVHGRDDRIIPPSWSDTLQSWLPHADLLSLSRCGHWSQIERAELFNAVALDFLTETNRTTGHRP